MSEMTLNDIFLGAAIAGVLLIVFVVWVAVADAKRHDEQEKEKDASTRKDDP